MKRYTLFLGRSAVLGSAFLPALVFAQKITTFEGLVNKFITIIKYVIPLIFAIALVAFLWGVFQYFFSGAEKKEEAKDFLLYGIIGLFIMVSVWGLVRILTGTFLLENAQPSLPTLGTGGSSGSAGGYYEGYPGGASYPARPTSVSGGSSPFDTNTGSGGTDGGSRANPVTETRVNSGDGSRSYGTTPSQFPETQSSQTQPLSD